MNRLLLCPKLYQYDTNILFDLGQMSAILDFTNNAMSKVFSNPTTRSGIPENPVVHTKIASLLLFCRKLYQFIV